MVFQLTSTPTSDADELLTVDDLAARTGMTVRTVRFYAAQGLLPVPLRLGRMAYYGPQHRIRLEFIRELQDYGYTLAGIERYLQRLPFDASPGELAVYRAMLVPWEPEAAEELTLSDLERRAGRPLNGEALEFLIAIGVLAAVGAERYRAAPSMLAMGIEMLEMPLPNQVLREAAGVIDENATAVAEGLTEVFRKGFWEPFRRGDLADVDQEQLAAVVQRLRPLAIQGLVSAFERAADRAIRQSAE
ncbi:MAG TPA: MerR family transcriptional regulator [Jatrophihabitans sp.]|jgi:DNA-binding transcriptional MerR regulator